MRTRWPYLAVLLLLMAVILAGLGCSGESSNDRSAGQAETIAEETAATESFLDPISGAEVAAERAPMAIFLDAVYYFESEGNRDTFRRNPEAYATTTCAVTGNPVPIPSAKVSITYGGRTWYFNTKTDMLTFAADPEKYATYRCPGCGGGGRIAKPTTQTASLDGQELHFCCSHCRDGFLADPSEYVAAFVPEGGIVDSTGSPERTE